MAPSAQKLVIGSIEAYSGKSGIILSLIHQLQCQGVDVAYGKPLGNCVSSNQTATIEADIRCVTDACQLTSSQQHPPLLCLDDTAIAQRLLGQDQKDYVSTLQAYTQALHGDLILIEGPGTLWEGRAFDLSIGKMASVIDAQVLLVVRYNSSTELADSLLQAKQWLGDLLLGVLINDISPQHMAQAKKQLQPFLEQQSIPVLGLLPRSSLLRSISVREIAKQLEATVLCRSDRLDLMVESLSIGAMNVNSALKYFRQGHNMAVVTGGDRTDLQLAALETSTHCLILTGQLPPQPLILSRAEDLEIPILSVNLDTLTTVEIVDNAFGKTRLQEPIKVQCIRSLMEDAFDLQRFIKLVKLELPVSTS